MKTKNSFPKKERLSSCSDIDMLYTNGKSYHVYPIRAIFVIQEKESGFQVLFSVSKRLFKRAVKRNILKRRMREAFRLNNHFLKENLINSEIKLLLAFNYTGKEICDYQTIENAVKELLHKVEKNIKSNSNCSGSAVD